MAQIARLSGTKRLLIDKANTTMLAIIGVTSFLVIFSLVASRALLSQSGYQSRVIKEKQKALKQLNENNKNVEKLVASYKSFAEEKQNVLGGSSTGVAPKDGDNPSIVLDALPSKYDFPAVISSMEKVLKEGGYTIDSLGGDDDEIAQQSAKTDTPAPVEMPFPISVTTTYDGAQSLLATLEKSIRPIYLSKVTFAAAPGGKLKLTIAAKTYYQPEKVLKITTKVVK
jgi:hypothetical protein